MSTKRTALTFAGILLLAGTAGAFWIYCSGGGSTAGLVFATPEGSPPLTLDIDYPPAGRGPFPTIVYIPHDPEWHPDFKQEDRIRRAVEVYTRAGYALATIHYRSPGKCPSPGPIQDAKAAVRFLRTNASQYRLNPDRIGAMGASVGGYGACMIGTTGPADGFDPPGDGVSCRVQAVAALAAPADLTRKTWPEMLERMYMRPFLGAGFAEKPDLYRKASPGTYAGPDDPPFLLLHSPSDPLVPFAQSKAFAQQLQAGGVPVQLTEVSTPGLHVASGDELERILQMAVPFFDEHLKK
jgi:acetyl esterase/lipase